MKIAFISLASFDEAHRWSGLHVHMANALERKVNTMIRMDNLPIKSHFLFRVYQGYYKFFLNKRFDLYREPIVVKAFGKEINARLADFEPDIIFSHSSIPIADLETEAPIVYWTDATFAAMIDFYPTFSSLARRTIENGHRIEKKALERSDLAIYSSEWAAESARTFYEIPEEKVKVVPFGGNITIRHSEAEVDHWISSRLGEPFKLLWFGTDWHRKGGDISLGIFVQLQSAGIKVELNIVGCQPVDLPGSLSGVNVLGFVDPHTEEGGKVLKELLASCHFLVLPARADCTPHVIAEVNAFGIPVLVSRVGGLPSMVMEGKNGHLVELDSAISDMCSLIRKYIDQPESYEALAQSAYKEYRQRLNWDVAGDAIMNLLHTNFPSAR